MKKKFLLVVGLLSMLTLVACGSNNKTDDSKGGVDKGDHKYSIGLSMNTQTNPFFVTVTEGVQKAADENKIKLTVTDAQDDPATQLKDVENLITKKPDAIIIDPTDSDAIIPAIEAANEAGIPVFTMDREASGGEVIAHVGYDAIKSGNLAGEFLVEQLKGKGKIVELEGIIGTNVARDRSKGFNEIMAKNKGMTVVAKQTAKFDRAEAMSVMENILQANKEIDGLYAANDEMLLGAMEAIQAAGRADEIIVIGCDGLDETLEGIKAGTISATIAEPPFFLGKDILNTAFKYLEGETPEKNVVLDNKLLTKDNVDTYVSRE